MTHNRREVLKSLSVPAAAASGLFAGPLICASWAQPAAPHTTISVRKNEFLINGKPTYEGRFFEKHKIQGLLFESRMVNAIVDDQNPNTRGLWAYPDGPWDPERNTSEFIAQFPHYRACGLTSIAFNIQGGSPQGYSWHQPWRTSGFESDGTLRPDYANRLARVIAAADAAGLVVILGLFYIGQLGVLNDEAAVIRAVDNVTELLCKGGYRNVMIEITNETANSYKFEALRPNNAHIMIERIQKNSAGRLDTPAKRLLVTTNCAVVQQITDALYKVSDFITLHGNGDRDPSQVRSQIEVVRKNPAYRGQPMLYTEDDHYDFEKPDNDMIEAVNGYAGWGFFDYRQIREPFSFGYQSLPVDWGIGSPRKRGFFTLLAQITGGTPPAQ